jgi:cytochrome P450 family 710 subfamily A protein
MFTPRALSTYIGIQESAIRSHFAKWTALSGYQNFQMLARDLTVVSSQNVFVGPYIRSDQHRTLIGDLYRTVTKGMLTFPINLPGTTLNKAIKAREKLIIELSELVEESKAAMRAGRTPHSLLDFWMEEEMRLSEKGEVTYDNEAVSFHVLDFLFASQDASTTSLVWAIDLLFRNPDVAELVRREQKALRPGDAPFTAELLEKMTYTNQVRIWHSFVPVFL